MRFEHFPGVENPANVLTKPLPWISLKIFVEPFLLWKGDTVDAPLGTSNPEGSDTGPRLRVPQEPSSHGCDSTQAGGHVFPAILCGNQCAVLYDTIPTDFEFLHGV